ncbi:Gfo/Idh/MocA family oxidoreductase [Fervidibacter sacchari]|jgi:Predicted dehydrogenases and related proteins|uniref:Dehydrogenase n=1 Tax=Candidatus Fervidibacter sacchari TaxID=1448929 RepID=A0ABT2ELS7_9BACT|nr:Gfo/Idh/MocA family oxidoreductase [Candidatus Fervidibacter sacchari]MCS3917908.1 putative dehydrogenase [Candidatus Fervidibacter sacchari]WKU15725.1 Gfo/Idh/MocA family oxidoreductase [Candidatus Fervidibacter sacchari]
MKVAIIGCGFAGMMHAKGYSQLEGVKIAGCCDIVPEKARELASRFGAEAFNDLEEMLEVIRPDIVSVCTLEKDHAFAAMAALKSGAHVLCEKMLASSLDEAKAMVQTAKEKGKLLATQFNYRHIPSIRWLKSLLSDGVLGEPLLVTLQTHSYCHHHSVDLLRFLFGEIVSVQATMRGERSEVPYKGWEGISDDLLYIPPKAFGSILHFESGLIAVVAGSFLHQLDDLMLELNLVTAKGRLSLRRMRQGNICGDLDTNLDLSGAPPFPEPVPFLDTFPLSVQNFVKAVMGEPAIFATGDDGLKAMEIEKALLTAVRTGQIVSLATKPPS